MIGWAVVRSQTSRSLSSSFTRKEPPPAGRSESPCLRGLSRSCLPFRPSPQPTRPTSSSRRRVRPLLLEHCLECHGPEQAQGRPAARPPRGLAEGGDSGSALVPGDTSHSLILKAVSYADRDLKMPPKQKLEAADVEVLTQWIAAGRASIPARLANRIGQGQGWPRVRRPARTGPFSPMKASPVVPVVKDVTWPRNDIDRFILAKLGARTPASLRRMRAAKCLQRTTRRMI